MLQVVDSNLDFKIGKVTNNFLIKILKNNKMPQTDINSKVIIHMNNLFNGENELLANTVNKFLNDHGQEVLKEVKPAIRFKFWNNC